jgi:cellobiose phosphorylase
VLSNGDYGLVLSQTGSGYSWRTHASLNRITRWSQDLVRDDWGKYLYIRDLDSGAFWSAGWHPAGHDLEAYQVRHGFGYSVIEWQRETLRGSLTTFVPLDDPCEVWLLRLENRGMAKHGVYNSLLTWNGCSARLQTGTASFTASSLRRATMKLTMPCWRPKFCGSCRARKDPISTVTGPTLPSTAPPSTAGYDGDKAAFLGRNGRLAAPQALRDGRSFNTSGRGMDAIASLQVPLDVAPGEVVEVVFTLGDGGR